jgi:hypothetical protein
MFLEHFKKFGRILYLIGFKSICIKFVVILEQIFMLYLRIRLFSLKCRFNYEKQPIFGGTVTYQSFVVEQKMY